MRKKNNNLKPNKNILYRKKSRNDGQLYKPLQKYIHVNASVESEGTTPIDISLMTGNGQTKEDE